MTLGARRLAADRILLGYRRARALRRYFHRPLSELSFEFRASLPGRTSAQPAHRHRSRERERQAPGGIFRQITRLRSPGRLPAAAIPIRGDEQAPLMARA